MGQHKTQDSENYQIIQGKVTETLTPTPFSKHAAPSARSDWSSGLHKELLSVTDVQTYGLQHVPFILYLVYIGFIGPFGHNIYKFRSKGHVPILTI